MGVEVHVLTIYGRRNVPSSKIFMYSIFDMSWNCMCPCEPVRMQGMVRDSIRDSKNSYYRISHICASSMIEKWVNPEYLFGVFCS